MYDFIKTSDFTHNTTALIVVSIMFIIAVILLLIAIMTTINNKHNTFTPLTALFGPVFLVLSILLFIVYKNSYAEYTGVFKVTDSTTNQIYENSRPTIVIKDKNNYEQALPVKDGTIYHKGDIVKVKIYVMKHHKPSLNERINYGDKKPLEKPAGAHVQTLKSIEKVK